MISIIKQHRQNTLNKAKYFKNKQQQKLQTSIDEITKIKKLTLISTKQCQEITIQQNTSPQIKLQQMKQIVNNYQNAIDQNNDDNKNEEKKEQDGSISNNKLIVKYDAEQFRTSLNSVIIIGLDSKKEIELKEDINFEQEVKKTKIMKFSRNLQTKGKFQLRDDDKCAKSIECMPGYILASAVPVNSGVHCWRIKVEKNENIPSPNDT